MLLLGEILGLLGDRDLLDVDLLTGDLLGGGLLRGEIDEDLLLIGDRLGVGDERLLDNLGRGDGDLLDADLTGDLFLGNGDGLLLGDRLGGEADRLLEEDLLDNRLPGGLGEEDLDFLITRLTSGDLDLSLGGVRLLDFDFLITRRTIGDFEILGGLCDLEELADRRLALGDCDLLMIFLGLSFCRTGGSFNSFSLSSKVLFVVSALAFTFTILCLGGTGILSVIT